MDAVKIGIGRVSTDEQNPQRQIDAFLAEGIEERYIFIDKVHVRHLFHIYFLQLLQLQYSYSKF